MVNPATMHNYWYQNAVDGDYTFILRAFDQNFNEALLELDFTIVHPHLDLPANTSMPTVGSEEEFNLTLSNLGDQVVSVEMQLYTGLPEIPSTFLAPWTKSIIT